MLPVFDPSGDYAVVDGLQTLSYAVKTGEGAFAAPVAVNYCLPRVPSKEDRDAAGAKVSEVVQVWHLWTVNLSGIVPKIDDRFTDPHGVVWLIRDAKSETLATRWRLTGVKAR